MALLLQIIQQDLVQIQEQLQAAQDGTGAPSTEPVQNAAGTSAAASTTSLAAQHSKDKAKFLTVNGTVTTAPVLNGSAPSSDAMQSFTVGTAASSNRKREYNHMMVDSSSPRRMNDSSQELDATFPSLPSWKRIRQG